MRPRARPKARAWHGDRSAETMRLLQGHREALDYENTVRDALRKNRFLGARDRIEYNRALNVIRCINHRIILYYIIFET